MITIEKLNAFGANTDEGLGRCFDNEEFYLKLVQSVPDEKSFDALKSAMDAGDKHAAFEAAHALKGVLSNLSLTALVEPATELVENLRAENNIDYEPLMEQLFSKKDELKKLCEE